MRTNNRMLASAQSYLKHRRQLGYQLRTEGPLLLQFAKFLDRKAPGRPLTTALAARWAKAPGKASRLYWARRLEIARCFARYLVILDPKTEIPPAGIFGKAHRRTRPHIYTDQEIAALLSASKDLRPKDGFRSRTYVTLLSLLTCTGLRISEALRLPREGVDLDSGILTIRATKFRKSRLVPLHPSTTRALSDYMRHRDRVPCRREARILFVSSTGKPLPYSTVCNTFQKVRQRAGLSRDPGGRWPRIHDLRHTFACRRLTDWYSQGIDVDQMLPALSTYLGHAKVSDTYWYITGFPELLRITAAKFERFALPTGGEA